MLKQSILLLLSVSILTACGSSSGNGGGPSKPERPPVNSIRPSTSPLSKIETDEYLNHPNAFKFEKGMFGTYSEMSTNTIIQGSKGPGCSGVGKASNVVLKLENDLLYTYEIEEGNGNIDFDSNGKPVCGSLKKTTKVRKAKAAKHILEFFSPGVSTSDNEVSYYSTNGQIQVYVMNESQANGASVSSQVLVSLDNPRSTPVFLGLSEMKMSIVASSQGNTISSEFNIKRESSGTNYPLESLRSELKSITYCDDTTKDQTCLDNQDMTALLN